MNGNKTSTLNTKKSVNGQNVSARSEKKESQLKLEDT